MASAKSPAKATSPPRHEPCACASSLRCECGCLLARFVNGQLELKCRRCKRTVMVTVEHELDGDPG
jgi:phage FluMu protein Com